MPAEIISTSDLYAGWTTLRAVRMRLDNGQEVTREVEDHGAAVAVLPYDPEHKTALLVRQLRAPVLLAAGQPDVLEVPAGMTDGGDPKEAARRELDEEVGLRITALEHVASAWSSPGFTTERIELYLARYSPDQRTGQGGGLASEHEYITIETIGLRKLWRMVEENAISDMKTLLLIQALRLRHGELFA